MCKRLPRFRFLLVLLFAFVANSPYAQQWLDYKITPRKDTINRLDTKKMKQGPWVIRYETIRGEPGYEEEGYFVDDKKEGPWRRYSLMGDLIARENYKWGFRDGKQLYYTRMGDLLREEGWKATNPQNPYDTIVVPDIDHPDRMIEKVIKHDAAEVKHGQWIYYDPSFGSVVKTEQFAFGQVDKRAANAIGNSASDKMVRDGIPTKNVQLKKDSANAPVKKPLPAAVQEYEKKKKGKG